MKIIKAQIKDFPAVQKIFKEYQKQLNTPICFQNFEQELDNLQSVYASPAGAIFLVLDAGRVIACVAYCPHKILSKTSETAELKRLYVHDDYKGQGVGKKLFLHALDEAQKQGYQSIVLETMDNMKQATSLYLQHGFKLTPPFSSNTDSNVKCYRYDFH
jgi:N-acetylglutamate synthase-like GNAT family acetyltransferase